MEIWRYFIHTIVIYLVIFFMVRLMGKREIGKLSVFDLVVSFMIAGVSAIGLEDPKKPLMDIIIPIATLVGLQILFAYISLKSKRMRRVIDGDPVVIIRGGKLQLNTMRKNRYNLDDLQMQLRDKNIADVNDVEFAILETSGKLSAFLKEDMETKLDQPFWPIPLIIEGEVQDHHLHKISRDRVWLFHEMQTQGHFDVKQIFYASYQKDGHVRFAKVSEGNKED